MKSQSESSFLAGLREERAEKILEVDGTLTTQPVLEHVGISAWPGLFFSFFFLSFHRGLSVIFSCLVFDFSRANLMQGG